MPCKVFSYQRFSTPEQQEGDSIRRQTEARDRWLKQHPKYRLAELSLQDLGVSAFHGKNAKQGSLAVFLEAVERGIVRKGDALLIENLDRLSRQPIEESSEIFFGILKHGVEIITLSPEYHFTKQNINDGRVYIAMGELSRAHRESAVKSDRITAAWKSYRDNIGKGSHRGMLPSWLRRNANGRLVAIPEKVATIKRIFQMSLDGFGVHQTMRILNENGIKPVGETKTWHYGSVHTLLTDRRLLGECQAYTGHHETRKPVGEPIKGHYPRVIADDVFNRVRQRLNSRRYAQRGRTGGGITNLFVSLIQDTRDNANMVIINKAGAGGVNRKYLVSAMALRGLRDGNNQYISFLYDAVEQALLQSMLELKPSDILPTNGKRDTTQEQLDAALGELAQTDRKLETVKTWIEQKPDIANYRDVVARLERKMAVITTCVEQLEEKLRASEKGQIDETKDLIRILQDAPAKDLPLLRSRLRQQIRNLVERIEMFVIRKTGAGFAGNVRHAYLNIYYKAGGCRMVRVATKNGEYDQVGATRVRYPRVRSLREKSFQKQIEALPVDGWLWG